MKDSLEYIVKLIVEKTDEVSIEEIEEEGITTYRVSVAKEDMGKVIGKEGKVIKAIRNIMKIPAIKQGKRINIVLAEEERKDEAEE